MLVLPSLADQVTLQVLCVCAGPGLYINRADPFGDRACAPPQIVVLSQRVTLERAAKTAVAIKNLTKRSLVLLALFDMEVAPITGY